MADQTVQQQRINWQQLCRRASKDAARQLQEAERALDHAAAALGEAVPFTQSEGDEPHELLARVQRIRAACSHAFGGLAVAAAVAGSLEQLAHVAEEVSP